jgi:hypothetical protein
MTDFESQRMLGEVLAEVRSVKTTVHKIDGRLTSRLNDHSKRIGKLERFAAWCTGVGVALVSIPSAAWAWLSHFSGKQ